MDDTTERMRARYGGSHLSELSRCFVECHKMFALYLQVQRTHSSSDLHRADRRRKLTLKKDTRENECGWMMNAFDVLDDRARVLWLGYLGLGVCLAVFRDFRFRTPKDKIKLYNYSLRNGRYNEKNC